MQASIKPVGSPIPQTPTNGVGALTAASSKVYRDLPGMPWEARSQAHPGLSSCVHDSDKIPRLFVSLLSDYGQLLPNCDSQFSCYQLY
jgi:hypothetical protein